MTFLTHFKIPINSFLGNCFLEQCMFSDFMQNVIFYNQSNNDVMISRSYFSSNNIFQYSNDSHVVIFARNFGLIDTVNIQIHISPNNIFIEVTSNQSTVTQSSFEGGSSTKSDSHYAFLINSKISKLYNINISNVKTMKDSGPQLLCKSGYFKYGVINDFPSFRTIFRLNQMPIEKLNIVNCSGQYLANRENFYLHFIKCVLYSIKLSNKIDFTPVVNPFDLHFDDCIIIDCNFSIPSEFILNTLFTDGHKISFQLVNKCIHKTTKINMHIHIKLLS